MVLIMVILLFLFLLLGFPIIIPLLVSSIVLLYFFMPDVNVSLFAQQLIGGIDTYVLMSIPLFIYAADIMSAGQTADRLVNFVKVMIGHIRGGLAITTVGACTAFGSISGSTQATVAAIGRPMRNRLLKAGYKDSSIMALIINSSDIAILIPPSTVMIMYAVVTKSNVGNLFISGVIPGLIIFLVFSLYCYISARINNVPVEKKATWKERLITSKDALLAFGFPVIILGGIYTGFFTPVESAAASVLYAIILEVFIYRAVKIKQLYTLALSTGMITAVVFLLVAAGQAFSWVLSFNRIPQEITAGLLGSNPSPMFILIIICLIFFIGCMFVDSLVVITVVTPIFFPIAMSAGIDPIYLGVLITLLAAIGSATPPFGCDIFTACAVFEKPFIEVIRGTPPYILMLIGVVVLMLVFPQLGMIYKFI
jgi:C4-dicarboxylate transporter DctM subunit